MKAHIFFADPYNQRLGLRAAELDQENGRTDSLLWKRQKFSSQIVLDLENTAFQRLRKAEEESLWES